MNNILSRLFFQQREIARSTAETTPTEQRSDVGKGADFVGRQIMINGHNESAALKISAFYRGVELRAKTMSQLMLEYQRWDKKQSCFVRDVKTPHSAVLNYLIQVQPNPLMTWPMLMQRCEIDKILQGNALVYIERDMSGDVISLWSCRYGGWNPIDNTYTITYQGLGGVICKTSVPSTDILHIRNSFTEDNGIVGISTLRYATTALSISATNDYQALDIAGKGGKMKLLVQEEKAQTMGFGRASKEQLQKITNQLNEDIYDKDVVLLNNVANVTPISQNSQQMELMESRKFSVSDVARFLSVPKILLMDDSGSSYKSPEAATQEFLLRTISPAIREWEAELNAKLIGLAGISVFRFHLCSEPLLRLDPKAQADIDKLHLETGVKSVNELRRQYDLPAIDKGDIHYISTNLAEVGSQKLSNNPTSEGGKS